MKRHSQKVEIQCVAISVSNDTILQNRIITGRNEEPPSPPDQADPPGPGRTPQTRRTPRTRQIPPPDRQGDPPRQGEPPDQADPPGPGRSPPPGSRLQHMVNEWLVRILLECILVSLFRLQEILIASTTSDCFTSTLSDQASMKIAIHTYRC